MTDCIACGRKINKKEYSLVMMNGEVCRDCINDIIEAQEPEGKI